MASHKKPNSFSAQDAEKQLNESLLKNDSVRIDSLNKLSVIQAAKRKMLERELKFIQKLDDSDESKEEEFKQKLDINKIIRRNLTIEIERTSTDVAGLGNVSWALHGRIRNDNLKSLPNMLVVMYDDKKKKIKSIAPETTDETGYFKFSAGGKFAALAVDPGAKPIVTDDTPSAVGGSDDTPSVAARIATGFAIADRTGARKIAVKNFAEMPMVKMLAPSASRLYLFIFTSQQKLVHMHELDFQTLGGGIDYREIVIDSFSKEIDLPKDLFSGPKKKKKKSGSSTPSPKKKKRKVKKKKRFPLKKKKKKVTPKKKRKVIRKKKVVVKKKASRSKKKRSRKKSPVIKKKKSTGKKTVKKR